MDRTGLSTEELVRKWEHRRAVKNLMGKYVNSLMHKEEPDMLEQYWSRTKKDICLGFNDGWYVGAEGIARYYDTTDHNTQLKSKVIQSVYPETKEKYTDSQMYGAGQMDMKPIGTCIVTVADDEQTAKGIWYSRGSYADVTPGGPVSSWTFGTYTADFVIEDGQWRLWHMQYLEDVNSICGQSWTEENRPYPAIAGFEAVGEIKAPVPDVKTVLREYYTPDRPFTKLPKLPEPYATFSETFSYGM